jgi:hypothetical protein
MSAITNHRFGLRFKVAWGVLLAVFALFDVGFGLVLWGEHQATHRIDKTQQALATQQAGFCGLVEYSYGSTSSAVKTTKGLIRIDKAKDAADDLAIREEALRRLEPLLDTIRAARCPAPTPTHP